MPREDLKAWLQVNALAFLSIKPPLSSDDCSTAGVWRVARGGKEFGILHPK